MTPPHGMKEVREFYGDNKTTDLSKGSCMGDPSWEHANLIVLHNVCGTGKSIQLHHAVSAVFQESLEEALQCCPKYTVRMLGGYCARRQRNDPSLPLSIHSYGAAFDVNWDKNRLVHSADKGAYDLPASFISCFTRRGWNWGGDWVSIKDYMHFQWATGC